MNAVSPHSRLQHRCAAKAEVCVGTHLVVENVTLECEAVGQYAGKVECVECQHLTLECVEPAVCGSPERGMSGDVGNALGRVRQSLSVTSLGFRTLLSTAKC